MKKITVFAVMMSLVFGAAVHAQEMDTHKKLAEELLVVTKISENLERSFEMMRKMQEAQLKELNLGEEPSQEALQMQKKMMDLMEKEMSWENLKDDYINIYVETFTPEDLKGIIAFYKSPAGQKFIEKQPELMQKAMQVSQKQMRILMPKIEKLTQELTEEMVKDTGEDTPAEEEMPAAEDMMKDADQ